MSEPRHTSFPFPQSSALSKHRLRKRGQEIPNGPSEPIDHIPGDPSIYLTESAVSDFLTSELSTTVLDELYNNLWLAGRKSGKSIDPLNRHRVKAREIIATEDTRLHLVWYRNKIYIKPMPLCLLNHDFWTIYLAPPAAGEQAPGQDASTFDRRVALGFMRSYALLIRHRVDFILAREAHLFPANFDWDDWSRFISYFRHIEDEDVANRYHYGQLRLSRLNWVVRLCRPSSAETMWFYEPPAWSIVVFLERGVAPLLFSFVTISLVLSSMQVLLSVPEEGLGLDSVGSASFVAMRQAFWVFCVIILLMSCILWALLFILPAGAIIWQLSWGFRNRGKTKTGGILQLKQEVSSATKV